MNLEGFCKEYQLGNVKEVEKITGGLLHKMWKVQTEQGLYAIKILNPEIMTREDAYNNFTKSEEISSLAQENGIQVSNAIRLKENYLNKFEELYYMVFPYIDGKPLSDEKITIEHCRKIAQVLAKIHALDTSKVKLEKKIEKYQRLYPWDQYIENKNFIKMPYKDLYLENYKKYNSILKRANERFNESNKIQTLCHRDMDQKNVLWDGETPIIIDWESAGLMNPYRELVEVALSWSGFLSNSFDEKKFRTIIEEYIKYRKFEHNRFFTICGNLVGRLGWLKYNLERSLGITTQDKEEVELSKKEVTKTILEINRYLQLIGPMYRMICSITKEEDKQYDVYIKTLIKKIPLLQGKNYTKIDKGFTNTIYNVGEYVVRICTNEKNEKRFQNEINFYKINQENARIPKLHMSDRTSTIIPYNFQIIEKIDGKTIYEIWYQLSEKEKKEILIQVIDSLKLVHQIKGAPYDFSKFIKDALLVEIKQMNLDKKKIKKLLLYCDISFKENTFGMIHGDLHFDNIIYKEGKIYLLDFERSHVAPIDYDFSILNRCKRKPWLWANEETDMLTIEEDYQNIMPIVIENYEELRTIPYLKDRLTFYELIEELKEYNKEKKQEQLEIVEQIIETLVDKIP